MQSGAQKSSSAVAIFNLEPEEDAMANQQQLAVIKQGVDVWNKWREEHTDAEIDLSKTDFSNLNLIEAFAGFRFPAYHRSNLGGAALSKANLKETNFHRADLAGVDFKEADLRGADLSETYLKGGDLRKADLRGARLSEADLRGANLTGANLSEADLRGANLSTAHLIGVNLSNAHLKGADLQEADFVSANLRNADLSKTYLRAADLRRADLRGANLAGAILVGTQVDNAKLSGSSVYATNFSELSGAFEEHNDLIITPYGAPVITVDHFQVAQFVYLILNHAEVSNAIQSITSKFVLIIGSFTTPERQTILNALEAKLREYDLLPMVFHLDRAVATDFTHAIKALTNLSYFVIADLTNPQAAPLELAGTLPDYQVPFVPIIQRGEQPFAFLNDLREKHNWVLDTFWYEDSDVLVTALKTAILDPAIAKHNELKLFQADLLKIRSTTDLLDKQ
jgi:uncharacterized protein YjbI with pentapeptide repeats